MYKLMYGGEVYFSGKQTFERADVLVSNGRIEAVGLSLDAPAAAERIDCTGKYLIPGLVDVHTHGRGGYDFNTATEEDIAKMRRSYAECGTTTLMATLASAEMESLNESIEGIGKNRGVTPGLATVGGIHLEGRYLNPEKRGAHATELLHKPDGAELGKLIDKMMPLPVHVSAALELADEDFFDAALSRGATLGIAHSSATYDEAVSFVERGARSFTHTFNAMRPIHHREPGNAAASIMCGDAYSEIICDGEHVHPAMIDLLRRVKPKDKLVLITDSMEAAGCPDGEYAIAGQKVFVVNGKALNVEGALAGSTLNLFTALRNFMRFCGVTLEEALPAATENPAEMVGLSGSCGRIEAGLRADIIVLDSRDEPEIEDVYAAGNRVEC